MEWPRDTTDRTTFTRYSVASEGTSVLLTVSGGILHGGGIG